MYQMTMKRVKHSSKVKLKPVNQFFSQWIHSVQKKTNPFCGFHHIESLLFRKVGQKNNPFCGFHHEVGQGLSTYKQSLIVKELGITRDRGTQDEINLWTFILSLFRTRGDRHLVQRWGRYCNNKTINTGNTSNVSATR